MPRCILRKDVYVNRQLVQGFSHGILLRENDRWSIIDPANNNELVRGMTDRFKQMLVDRGMLTILEPS